MPKGLLSYPVLLKVPPGSERRAASHFREMNGVRAATPNYYVRPALSGLEYSEGFIGNSLQATGLARAGPGCGTNVKIAVLDTGVDPSVLDLGWDDTWWRTDSSRQFDTDAPRDGGSLMPYDPCGHGTVVASLIKRGAPAATIVPIKVMTNRGNLMGVLAGLYTAILT
jgi:subtilisin family serine protease